MAQRTPTEAVNYLLASGSQAHKRRKIGILFSFWWEMWKERNRRVFEGSERSPNAVAALTLEAVKMVNFVYTV